MKLIKKIKKIENLLESLKRDLNVLYPLTKSKRILTDALSKIRIGLSECINLSLAFQVKRKKIKLSPDKNRNLQYFFKTSKEEFKISENEISEIKKFLELARFQRESEINFVRKRNSVYMFSKGKLRELKLKDISKGTELIEILFDKIILEEKIKNLKR